MLLKQKVVLGAQHMISQTKYILYEDSSENPLLFDHVKKNNFATRRRFYQKFYACQAQGRV